ncbi:MAG: FtsW/RodA/SpoVE family cell cycle protein [Lachnospiraceae bacterium]
MFRQYKLKDYNIRLVLWLAALSFLGVLLVTSAEASLRPRQIMSVLLGAGVMLVLSFIDYSWILHFSWVLYLINVGLLAMVRLMGHSSHGATRWIQIGSSFTFQPVELSKIILILFFAFYFMKHENDLSRPSVIFRSLLLIGFPLGLIVIQPDLKNTLTIGFVFALLYFAAGLNYRIVVPVVALAAVLGTVFMVIVTQPDQTLIQNYQKKRIMAFLEPDNPDYTDDTLQQNNSVIAIGSGMVTGKGLNNSNVSSANKGNFVSQVETDFIFSVAGEELGFIGTSAIILLLLLVVLECLHTGRRAKDLAGRLICSGVASVVAIQSFINIGVATRILPNTGTPLPFISYGPTSEISLFIGMGLVLNVGLQNRIRPLKNPYGRIREKEDV